MQHNCFVLNVLVKELNKHIQNKTLVKCFSNTADELYFEFDGFAFKCQFYKGEIYFVFDQQIIQESRLYKPQFQILINENVNNLTHYSFERSFEINFSNAYSLVFKCHGRKSNVILLEKDKVVSVFKTHLESDLNLLKSDLNRMIIPEFYPITNSKVFNEKFPYLFDDFYEALMSDNNEKQFNYLFDFYLNKVSLDNVDNQLKFVPLNENLKPLDAITKNTYYDLKNRAFSDLKNSKLIELSKKIIEKKKWLQDSIKALETVQLQRNNEEIGNIILSNLHRINESESNAVLLDIYNNTEINVKLNPKLTAAENASHYFKKEKSKLKTIELLSKKIDEAKKQLNDFEIQLQAVTEANEYKLLGKISSKNKEEKIELPYKLFEFKGHEILVGKNAESNDYLLSKVAKPDDYWLHAKDVSGSHVLIKYKKDLKEEIILKAASIAAYYSKQKTQSLATVIVTQRKFVRKIKGAEKGKVKVMQERTVLVEPGLL